MNWQIQKHSYGIALIFTGQPIIWVIRDILGAGNSQIFSIVFMVIGLFLTTYQPNLSRCCSELFFPPLCRAPLRLVPLIFLVPSLIAALFVEPADLFGALYILFTFGFLISINTVPYERLFFLPQALLVVSGVACILVLGYAIANGVDLQGQRLIVGTTNSPGQISSTAAYAMTSGFFVVNRLSKSINSLFRVFSYAVIAVGTAVFFLAFSRSRIISVALCVLFAIGCLLFSIFSNSQQATLPNIKIKRPQKSIFDLTEINLIIIALFLLGIMLNWENILDALSPLTSTFEVYQKQFIDYTINGFQTYTEGTEKEASAAHRRMALDYAIQNINAFGHGYKSKWLDFPLLQSFYDSGILGGSLFLFITLLIPLFLIIKLKFFLNQEDIISSISIYTYIIIIPAFFFHGQPYEFFFWFRVVFLYSIMSKNRLFLQNKVSYKYHS